MSIYEPIDNLVDEIKGTANYLWGKIVLIVTVAVLVATPLILIYLKRGQ